MCNACSTDEERIRKACQEFTPSLCVASSQYEWRVFQVLRTEGLAPDCQVIILPDYVLGMRIFLQSPDREKLLEMQQQQEG